jgi:pentatricopeptide repeat domain-containing protein 1
VLAVLAVLTDTRARSARSALMNVCIKANEVELALDVYQQMLSEGCIPNLVTYNILVDVYARAGRWKDAVDVLNQLFSQVG